MTRRAFGSAPPVPLPPAAAWGLLAAALLVGLAFRFTQLDARPMHHDEANQAVKFGALLETGEYRYDRLDHHGPTLYYLTLPSAWLRGQHSLAALDEVTVRAVPAAFGTVMILLFALLVPRLGGGAAAAGALFAAVSPALTYYSRFYIQEAAFTCFVLAFLVALGNYWERRSTGWAVACGLLAGLLMATKETWLIVVPAAILACAAAARSGSREGTHAGGRPFREAERRASLPRGSTTAHHAPSGVEGWWSGATWPLTPVVLAAASAFLVLLIFYSSFFTHPDGPLDWLRSLPVYGSRGLEGGAHRHPWHYYLGLLGFSRSEGVTWSEGLVLALALCGAAFAFTREPEGSRHTRFWPRYICLYSLVAALVFSALPYKTPWNLLPFYVGFPALAGYGAAHLLAHASSRLLRVVLLLALVAGGAQLAQQAWRANFRYAADPRNPYVYAHTSTDFLRLVQRVTGVASVHPDGQAMFVEVVAGPYEQWPLPWYLRRMTRVGYWPSLDEAAGTPDAPVIVASAPGAAALEGRLSDRYVSEYYGLRPGVLLTLFVERGLWESYISQRK